MGQIRGAPGREVGARTIRTPLSSVAAGPHLLNVLSHLLSSVVPGLCVYSYYALFQKGFGMTHKDKYQRKVKNTNEETGAK